MEAMEAILTRRSIRRFKPDPLPRPAVERILAAAVQAPSAKNEQNWRFVVLEGAAKDGFLDVMGAALAALPPQMPKGSAPNSLRIMRQAPVVIAVLNTGEFSAQFPATHREQEDAGAGRALAAGLGPVLMGIELQGVAAAIQNILLAAHASGLGGLWICDTVYAHRALTEHLRALAGDGELVAAVALGYVEEGYRPPEAARDWRKATVWPGRDL